MAVKLVTVKFSGGSIVPRTHGQSPTEYPWRMSENTEGLGYQNASRPGVAGQSPSTSRHGGTGSVIGPTLVVRGEITAEEDLLIRGRVEGTIDHNQTLKVHSEGSVEAVVRAKEIHVEGRVEGDLFGTQRVTVLETGKVQGNVVAPRVGVMEGAHFKGMVDMDSDTAAIERRFQEQTKSAGSKIPKSSEDETEALKGKGASKGSRRAGKAIAAADPEPEDAAAEGAAADTQDSEQESSAS
jgi:cytoskeletal protein CcmA (bactofilin family)